MRSILTLAALVLGCTLFAQSAGHLYNKSLADSLGADEYGMKYYTFVILKSGPNKIDNQEKLNELFRGHLDNIGRLADEGKLVVAGPFGKNDKSYRGLYILNAPTLQDAQALLDTDPAIKAGVFDVELYQWYGSAALPEYLKVHKQIEKSKH
ncbi:MAG: hypothetical protein JNK41_10640 [Saprospiraceae bacterium]|jgi:uncharacterized protein YciI|nr:hypothetical protein [Saprospiraceae bacterium]